MMSNIYATAIKHINVPTDFAPIPKLCLCIILGVIPLSSLLGLRITRTSIWENSVMCLWKVHRPHPISLLQSMLLDPGMTGSFMSKFEWGDINYWRAAFHSFLYPRPTKLEGGYTGFTLSVRLSVCPSVCRRHGFRSISQVCFGISISNFICMLMVAIGGSLLIFSDVTFKMAAWRPYWIFWFPDSNFTLVLNINFKLQRHNTYVYG